VFLKKTSGGERALDLANICWRIGAAHIVNALEGWIRLWLPPELQGGFKGRGIHFCHSRIAVAASAAAAAKTHFGLIAEDLTKAFEKVHITQTLAILRHLRAPEGLVSLLTQFYGRCKRVFSRSGCCSEHWHRVAHGLLTGCPFSPMLLSVSMLVWAACVKAGSNVSIAIFLDDRNYWAAGAARDVARRLQAAKAISDEFDAVIGHSVNCGKSQVAAATPPARAALSAAHLGYGAVSHNFDTLGLAYNLADLGSTAIKQNKHAKASRRLRRIAFATRSVQCRTFHVRTLVLPMWTWASAFVRVQDKTIQELRTQIAAAIWPAKSNTAAIPLIFETINAVDADPGFAVDWAALRMLCHFARMQFCSPAWFDEVDLQYATSNPVQWAPRLGAILGRLGWAWDAAMLTLSRIDCYGVLRVLRLDRDGPQPLRSWLRDHWAKRLLAKCKRVQSSLHRLSATPLACGLVLGLPAGALLCAKAHAKTFKGSDPTMRSLAVGTGLSYWYGAAKVTAARRADPADRCHSCICGLPQPSLAHLVWNCQGTQDLLAVKGIRRPRDRAEERLLCSTCEECPAPARISEPEKAAMHTRLRAACAQLLGTSRRAVATDGSADFGVAAWSVHFWNGDTVAQHSDGEDGEAYAAELAAIAAFTSAMAAEARFGDDGAALETVVLVDCLSALQAIRAPALGDFRFGLLHQIRVAAGLCAARGAPLRWHWIPSHGKASRQWRPPAGFSEAEARDTNARADVAAKAAMIHGAVVSGRRDWHRDVAARDAWALGALDLARQVRLRYFAHLGV
jgi:hypothetical protein